MISKKNSSFCTLFKIAISEWTDYATENSLQNFSHSTRIFVQFVYAIVFITSASYCLFSIGTTIDKYYQYETVTSLKIINELPADFPAVSFCNLKRLNKTSAKNFMKNILFENDDSPVIEFDENHLFTYYYDVSDYLMLGMAELNENEQVRKSYGFVLEDMLLNCRFNLLECDKKDFKYFFHSQYGNCYTFNFGNQVKESILPGPKYGLELLLFLGDPNVHSEFEMNDGIVLFSKKHSLFNSFFLKIFQGIVMVVHNKSNFPFLNNDRILAATGAATDLKINRHFITKLGPPYTECIKNDMFFKSEFHKYIVNELKIKYTQQHCFSLCLQNEVIKECKCSSNWLLNFKDKNYCTSEELDCILDNVGSGLSGKIPNNCVEACPLECDNIEYDVATSRISYPSPYVRNLLSKHPLIISSGIKNEMIDKSVLKVHIYYETLAYRTIAETESMTAQIFFSNAGGIFSLCLGISILSLVKFVGFIVSILVLFKEKKCEVMKHDLIQSVKSNSLSTSTASFSSSSRKKKRYMKPNYNKNLF
jgi:hypothetical protein